MLELLPILLAAAAAADTAAGIGAAVARPVLVRGGVAVLPLAAARPGDGWPASIPLELADGATIEAAVAWIGPASSFAPARWTDEATGLSVRAVRPEDSTATALTGAPFLVVRLPDSLVGDFRIAAPALAGIEPVGGGWVRPQWMSAAPPSAPADAPALERRLDPALPDPESPFEHWRWALLADRRGLTAPAPPGEGLAALVAEHGAEAWRAGLARLAGQSPGVAAACREALTQTVVDGDREIAAWICDPVQTSSLLAILLDVNRAERAMLDAALGWVDSRDPLLAWIESAGDGPVAVALANASLEPRTVRLAWAGMPDAERARELAGGEAVRLALPRPEREQPEVLAPNEAAEAGIDLAVSSGAFSHRLRVAPGVVPVRPPGWPLPEFRPPLRLVEARSGMLAPMPAVRGTAGMLRRASGRWEIFLECARPGGIGEPQLAASEVVPPRGVEAITLWVGDPASPRAVLCVPESGEPWMAVGEQPLDLEVHRRSLATAWRCRIVLPAAWLPPARTEPFLFGLGRTHSGDGAVEFCGLARPPWHEAPAPLAVDLSGWSGFSRRRAP